MNVRTLRSGMLCGAVAAALLAGTASVATACPSCQQALGSDPGQGDLASGIYYSILFMMSMPFAIVGTFATLAYRAVKREQRRVESLRDSSANSSDELSSS